MSVRLLATALLAVLGGVALSACDGPANSPTPSPPPTAVEAGPAALDPCLVGTWRSTGISGTFTIAGAAITLAGGSGEVLTISSEGAIRTDDSASTPVGGSAPDGTDYRLLQTGTATGTVNSAGGRIKVNIDQPTTLTVTLYKNGTPIQRQHPGSANDTYTCATGSSLVITGAGGVVTTYAHS